MEVFEKQGLVACLSGIKIVEKEAKEKLAHGFFDLDHDVTANANFEVPHGLGKVPDFFYFRVVDDATIIGAEVALLWAKNAFAASSVNSLRQVNFSTLIAAGGIVRVGGVIITNDKFLALADEEKMTITTSATAGRTWMAAKYEWWAF